MSFYHYYSVRSRLENLECLNHTDSAENLKFNQIGGMCVHNDAELPQEITLCP